MREILDRIADDPVYYALRLILAFIAFVVLLFIFGCSTPNRYLTEAQDKEMRETCELHGCSVINNQAYEQIQRALRMCGFRGI